MTRINCIPVSELTREHLIAEYRELPRLFKLARTCSDIPTSYRMGEGHVKFFYNKLTYLVNRFNDILDEMDVRGYCYNKQLVNKRLGNLNDKPRDLFNNWSPTPEAIEINRQRIRERLTKRRTRNE